MYKPAGVSVRRSPPDNETPPSARLYRSQPTTPLSRPLRLTAHPPVLRITQPTTRVWLPPAIVTAVPRQVSSVMPRSVTYATSFMVTSLGSTEIIGLPFSIGAGGQKYKMPVCRSRYHSPGRSSSVSRL